MRNHNTEQHQSTQYRTLHNLFFEAVNHPSVNSFSTIYDALKDTDKAEIIARFIDHYQNIGIQNPVIDILKLAISFNRLPEESPAKTSELLSFIQNWGILENPWSFLVLRMAGKIFETASCRDTEQNLAELSLMPFIPDLQTLWHSMNVTKLDGNGTKLLMQKAAEYCFCLSLQRNYLQSDLYQDLADLILRKFMNQSGKTLQSYSTELRPLPIDSLTIHDVDDLKMQALRYLGNTPVELALVFNQISDIDNRIQSIQTQRAKQLKVFIDSIGKKNHKSRVTSASIQKDLKSCGYTMSDLKRLVSSPEDLADITIKLSHKDACQYINQLISIDGERIQGNWTQTPWDAEFIQKMIKNHVDYQNFIGLLHNDSEVGGSYRLNMDRRLCKKEHISPHIKKIRELPGKLYEELNDFAKKEYNSRNENHGTPETDTQKTPSGEEHTLSEFITAISQYHDKPGKEIKVNDMEIILQNGGYNITVLQNIIQNKAHLNNVVERMGGRCRLFFMQYLITDRALENRINFFGKTNLAATKYSIPYTSKLMPAAKDIHDLMVLIPNEKNKPLRHTWFSRVCEKESILSPHIKAAIKDASEGYTLKDLEKTAYEGYTGEKKMKPGAPRKARRQSHVNNTHASNNPHQFSDCTNESSQDTGVKKKSVDQRPLPHLQPPMKRHKAEYRDNVCQTTQPGNDFPNSLLGLHGMFSTDNSAMNMGGYRNNNPSTIDSNIQDLEENTHPILSRTEPMDYQDDDVWSFLNDSQYG